MHLYKVFETIDQRYTLKISADSHSDADGESVYEPSLLGIQRDAFRSYLVQNRFVSQIHEPEDTSQKGMDLVFVRRLL